MLILNNIWIQNSSSNFPDITVFQAKCLTDLWKTYPCEFHEQFFKFVNYRLMSFTEFIVLFFDLILCFGWVFQKSGCVMPIIKLFARLEILLIIFDRSLDSNISFRISSWWGTIRPTGQTPVRTKQNRTGMVQINVMISRYDLKWDINQIFFDVLIYTCTKKDWRFDSVVLYPMN